MQSLDVSDLGQITGGQKSFNSDRAWEYLYRTVALVDLASYGAMAYGYVRGKKDDQK